MMIGIDEVGRGCWAGPLVASAVLLDDMIAISGLKDSKKLSERMRSSLNLEIQKKAQAIGLGWVDAKEVDVLGLTESVRLAMRRALEQIDYHGIEIVIDGNYNFLNDIPLTTAVIKADDSVPAVSAASIVAKVARDTYMKEIASKYPHYSFEKHVGYGTSVHRSALQKYGVTEIHRLSYEPIKALL